MSVTVVSEAQVARLMDGFLTTQLLYVAAQLGIADELTEGPRSATELAQVVGARTGPLARVLRGLAIEGVIEDREDGRFALTAAGARLAELHGPLLARGEVYYRAAGGLLDAVRDGGIPFERIHGESFFAHLDRHPDRQASFEASMAARSEREARDVVAGLRVRRARHADRRRRRPGRADVGDPRRPHPACEARSSTGPTAVRRPGRGSLRSGLTGGATASSETSSPRCRAAPTRTCCRE